MVILILVQIILGFATLDSGSPVIAWVHLVNAIAIYGMAIAGTVMTMRWDQMSRERFPAGKKRIHEV